MATEPEVMRQEVVTAPAYPSAAKARLEQLRLQFHVFTRNTVQKFSLGFLIVLIIAAVLAPYIVPHPESITGTIVPQDRLLAPSLAHPFGTDEFGRDLFSRVVYGARISLMASFATIGLAVSLGALVGVVAATVGGVVDEILMRIVDIFLAFPTVILAILIAAFWGGSLTTAIIALAVGWWPWYARLVRGQALSLRERPYVRAAQSIGSSSARIMFGHILRNSLGPTLVVASLDMGYTILSLAALGFLGLGAQSPVPEWGLLINQSREFFLDAWWYMAFPGIAIGVTAFSFAILGEGLGIVFNPKTRGRG
jgi:peptide/nickel transport system permease protein